MVTVTPKRQLNKIFTGSAVEAAFHRKTVPPSPPPPPADFYVEEILAKFFYTLLQGGVDTRSVVCAHTQSFD